MSKCWLLGHFLTLSGPIDYSLPGSCVHRVLQQEYRSGRPFLSPGYLSDPGIKHGSPALQADSLLSEPPGNFHSTPGSLKNPT